MFHNASDPGRSSAHKHNTKNGLMLMNARPSGLCSKIYGQSITTVYHIKAQTLSFPTIYNIWGLNETKVAVKNV